MFYVIPLRTTLGKCLLELGMKDFLRNQGHICMNPYLCKKSNKSVFDSLKFLHS